MCAPGMTEFQPPLKTSIDELQKQTDQWVAGTEHALLDPSNRQDADDEAVLTELLQLNGFLAHKRFSLTLDFGTRSIEIYPHVGWDEQFIAQLGGDPHIGAWGTGETVEAAGQDLLKEIKERITPDGCLTLRGGFAAAFKP
jgi:hypothetical protein